MEHMGPPVCYRITEDLGALVDGKLDIMTGNMPLQPRQPTISWASPKEVWSAG